jgi:predicted secreted protein
MKKERTMLQRLAVMALAGVVFVNGGLRSSQADTKKVTRTLKEKGSTVELAPGELLVIDLPTKLSTGYNWYPVGDAAEKVLKFKKQTPEPTDRPGGDKRAPLVFEATKSGTAKLRLVYVRPNSVEKDEHGNLRVKEETFRELKLAEDSKDFYWLKIDVQE